jgi:excisionase family DNA binding protein
MQNVIPIDKANHVQGEVPALAPMEFMNPEQAATYLSVSLPFIYKLSSTHRLPFYKPGGKKIYFKRSDLDNYITQKRIASREELEHEATLIMRQKRFAQ